MSLLDDDESYVIDECRIEFSHPCNSYEKTNFMNSTQEDEDHNKFQDLCLSNAIHQVSDRLNKFCIDESKFLKDLKQWRHEAHDIIDKFYKSKHDEYVRRTNEDIDQSRETLTLLSCDHDASQDYVDWVNYIIQSIHQQIDELEQATTKFSPLKIDHSLIDIPCRISDFQRHPSSLKDLFSCSSSSNELASCLSSSTTSILNLNPNDNDSYLSFEVPKHKLNLQSDYWYSLSTNSTYLLVLEKSNLCLIDQSFRVTNKKTFSQSSIKDICWSNILSRFILISPKTIYTLDEKFISVELSSITSIHNAPWERATCHESTLFISTFGENPLILEYNIFPSIHLDKRWQSSIICQENEIINDMKSNENNLGLIINNDNNNESRLELRSIKSFECIWSIDLGDGWSYRCSPLHNNHWIVVDPYNSRLIKINSNGTIDQTNSYIKKPINVVSWSQNQFVIRTREHVYIHQYS
ncbi:unnamed protein product [Rotaria sp. Silwood1]|nr:unnamed protein product [Rotaria sp. Silwood1]CAF1154372.1 unnamed protein product [Rotaria sp. Silwood1]CAF3441974.1 unnamed protein product [Rotaria sp. Silwood1]CAF3470260.1 unnamed protein product [Rotaria sp. Silwood1]CAF3580424.1 unnamed protein product [Rotaria sp. Silwood1]